MLPGEVLDAQGDLLTRLQTNPDFRDVVGLFSAVDGLGPDATREMILNGAGKFADQVKNAVQASYPYRVSYDMCTLLEAAAMDLDETDTWDLTIAPTEFGFVRFDKPLEFVDQSIDGGRGNRMLVHFVIWGRGDGGSVMWAFNDRYSEPDGSDEIAQIYAMAKAVQDGIHTSKSAEKAIERVRRASGRWNPVCIARQGVGKPLGPPVIIVKSDPEDPDAEDMEATNLIRHMHALWLMLNQTITVTSDEHPERHARKRAIKKGIPSKVTLIHLRRAVYPHREEGESLVEWSHRWPVRGHWAWRACSDKHPQAVQGAPVKGGVGVRVYIAPYIKGPDDKPLVLTQKVFSLER